MLQKLPVALEQVKAGNAAENLQIKFIKSYIPCIQQNKFIKKVYNNMMNSIKI